MKSETELHKLVKEAQERGSVIFATEDYKGDRQKLYRMKQAFEDQFPVLAATWAFKLKRVKPNGLKILFWEEQKTEIIEEKKEVKQVVVKPKKQPKMLRWIEKELGWIADAERLYKEKVGSVPKDTAEFFDTRKVAAQYYMELLADDIEDFGLEKVIRASSADESFVPLVLAAYGFADYKSKPKTIDEQIVENAKLIAETEPGDLLDKLVEMQERLRKLRDEQDLKKDLLG